MYRYKPKKIKYPKFKRFFTICIIIFCVSYLTILLHNMYLGIEINPVQISNSSETDLNLTRTLSESKIASRELADVIEEASKSVVGISKIKNNGSAIFFNNSSATLGLGTGIIVTDNGYILTNEHVCGSKYSTCYVTLESGKTYSGSVVWADSSIDLAIVKINAKLLSYCKCGDSSNIRVGESVYAIGNPIGFEFQRTVTSGIISALDRTVKINENDVDVYMEDLIQTDATINPRQ